MVSQFLRSTSTPLTSRFCTASLVTICLTGKIFTIWVASTIGHHTFHTRWPKNAIQELRDAGIEKPKSMTMPSLQPIILEHFPMLADWPSQRVTWADLMFIESEIVIGT